MKLRSAGIGSNVMLAAFDGEVHRGERWLTVRTPTNPSFWFGNFVVFDAPPRAGERSEWERVFADEVGSLAGVRHVNLTWDVTDGGLGAAEEFVAAGYARFDDVFLAAHRTHPAERTHAEVEVRPLATDDEWSGALAVQHATADPPASVSLASFQAFQSRNHDRYRAMAAAGFGHGYGAFLDGRVVASMGVFGHAGDDARCQAVATDPEFQRRGIGAALVHGACEHARRALGCERILIQPEPGGAAQRLYESIGFALIEKVTALVRHDGDESRV